MKISINTSSNTSTTTDTGLSWNGRTRGSPWGYRFFVRIIKLFGVSPAYGFAGFIVFYYIIFAPRASAGIFRYFRKRHGFGRGKSAVMTYRNFYRFSQVLIDKTALPAGFAKDFSYQFENYDDFLQILNDQTGCILIGAHVGNWDAAGQFFGNYGSRINIVMLDAEHRRIKNLLDSLHGDKNYKVIALKTDGSHVFEIGKALVDKEYVCFQGDRYMKGAPTLTENLLGAPALFPAGPFQTAGRSGVPVVFFFAMRERKRCYRFLFRVANIDRSATKDKGSESIAEQYVQALEQILHRYPEQWFNYYDFWEEGKAV